MFAKDTIQCIIFDYGGTLDTNARHWAHVLWDGFVYAEVPITNAQFREAYVFGERALAKAPIIKATDDFYTLLYKKVMQEMAWLDFKGYYLTDRTTRQALSKTVARFCNDYVLRNLVQSREVLHALGEKYKLVLVSNFYGNIETILRTYDLAVFEHVIESAVVGVRKPDPRIWQLGIDAAKCRPDNVVVVGDSYGKDIVPASSLGCHTIWLKGEGWSKEEVYNPKVPDAIVDDLKKIQHLL